MPEHVLIIIACLLFALLAAILFVVLRKKRARENIGSTDLYFTRLILHEHGCTAEENEYELVKTEKGLRISNYFGNWWDEGEGVHSRKNCLAKRRGGSMELYNELADEFGRLGVASWDGFNQTDPNVLDGGGFWLEIELENGEYIYASGMNSYPKNYRKFVEKLHELFENREQRD